MKRKGLVQFKRMNMYYDSNEYVSAVYSYNTLIGYAYWKWGVFKTWGYGTYSRTTSKQITIFCNTFKLKRVDIEKENYL